LDFIVCLVIAEIIHFRVSHSKANLLSVKENFIVDNFDKTKADWIMQAAMQNMTNVFIMLMHQAM
jgi:hypothetical protein